VQNIHRWKIFICLIVSSIAGILRPSILVDIFIIAKILDEPVKSRNLFFKSNYRWLDRSKLLRYFRKIFGPDQL
jgi:hypothetical protein